MPNPRPFILAQISSGVRGQTAPGGTAGRAA